ncbi:hypothetical protein WDW89_15000 [Deltaproteobacteria bacterium TL4]
MNKQICLLDCTLRDGSYVINYQFTAEDTYLIAHSLAQANIQYIEVGHGLGLDAQAKGKGNAAESDLRYIESAVDAVGDQAKIGVFFIPGIGELESIRNAAKAGIRFIRVGTNVYESHQAKASIELAKSLGLEVSANLMKSYVVSPSEFSHHCNIVASYGADTACLVDSAGGMTPEEVRKYVKVMHNEVGIQLGFHSHNNLQLAIANCLVAAEEGVQVLDSSLYGMGRSAGNAVTEILAALLHREGYDLGNLDWEYLICLAESLIYPYIPKVSGEGPERLASGLNYFHSSFQELVSRVSAQCQVQPYETILNLGVDGRSVVTEKMAREAALKANGKKILSLPPHPHATSQIKSWKSMQPNTLAELFKGLQELIAKTGYTPVLTIARSRNKNQKKMKITPLRTGYGYCVAHLETPDSSIDQEIFKALEINPIFHILIDQGIPFPAKLHEVGTVIGYDDDWLTQQALIDFVRVHPRIQTFYTASADSETCSYLTRYVKKVNTEADVGIVMSYDKAFTTDDLLKIRQGGILLLVQIDILPPEILQQARSKNLSIYRLDFSEVLIGEVSRVLGAYNRLSKHAGSILVQGIEVVAGGVIGINGSVVVNSISHPTQIYGIADGVGGVLPFQELESDKQEIILQWMLKDK